MDKSNVYSKTQMILAQSRIQLNLMRPPYNASINNRVKIVNAQDGSLSNKPYLHKSTGLLCIVRLLTLPWKNNSNKSSKLTSNFLIMVTVTKVVIGMFNYFLNKIKLAWQDHKYKNSHGIGNQLRKSSLNTWRTSLNLEKEL